MPGSLTTFFAQQTSMVPGEFASTTLYIQVPHVFETKKGVQTLSLKSMVVFPLHNLIYLFSLLA